MLSSFRLFLEAENEGFSGVHKVQEHAPDLKPSRAPFWSDDMTRHRMSYVPLPLDSAPVNFELAKANAPPNHSAAIQIPFNAHTHYQEWFHTPSRATKADIMRPKQLKHVRDDNHLLVVEPISHEHYPTYPAKYVHVQEAIHSDIVKPTKSNAGFHFNAKTAYADEYDGSAPRLMREQGGVQKVTYEDNSSRVWGNIIPNNIRNYLNDHEGFDEDNHLKSGIPPMTTILHARDGKMDWPEKK